MTTARSICAWRGKLAPRARGLDETIKEAIARWGSSRVSTIAVAEDWPSNRGAWSIGPAYSLIAREGECLVCALANLDANISDAVLLYDTDSFALLERVSRSKLRLEPGLIDPEYVMGSGGSLPTLIADLSVHLEAGTPIPGAPELAERIGIRTAASCFTLSLSS